MLAGGCPYLARPFCDSGQWYRPAFLRFCDSAIPRPFCDSCDSAPSAIRPSSSRRRPPPADLHTPQLRFRPAPPDPPPVLLLSAACDSGLRFPTTTDAFTRRRLLTRRHVDALTPVSPSSTTPSSSLLLLWRTRVLRRPLCRALNRLLLLHPWSHPTPRRPPSSPIYKTRRPPSMAPTMSRDLPPSSGSLRSTVASPISPTTRLPSRHPTSRLGSSRIASSPPGC